MSIGGIVLCGGRSTRMGQPKAWLPVGGEVMLQRIVRIVSEVVSPVVVVAAEGQDSPELPADVEIVREPGDRGPLQGLVTGMQALVGRVDAAYVTACDVPFLSADFIRRIIHGFATTAGTLASMPKIAGRLHPLAAAYSLDALPLLANELAARRLRLTDLAHILPTVLLTESDLLDLRPLRNVNTPEEYEQARRELLN